MAILKNRTQGNFVIISQNITHDKKLSMTERGLLLTLLSLPDGWNLSVAGLKSILPDGKEKISNALNRLIDGGYVTREQGRSENGKFGNNYLEVHEVPVKGEPGKLSDDIDDENRKEFYKDDCNDKQHDDLPITDKPNTENPTSVKSDTVKPSAENLPQYYNKHINNQEENNNKSNNQKCDDADYKKTKSPADTLDDNAYQSLICEFGAELVDYMIGRIRENHYKGCMNYPTIRKWCDEYKSRKPVKKPRIDHNSNSKSHNYRGRSYSKDFFDSLIEQIL